MTLDPGESRELTFALGMRDLARWDRRAGEWVADAGEHLVWAGTSSRDVGEPATLVLTERWTAPASGRRSTAVSSVARRCTRSSGSATSPGPPAPTRRCSCARPPRRCRRSAAIRPGWWRPAGGSSIAIPTSAPLWWLCARVLTSPDGQREAWDAVDEIEGDRTAAELAFALPEDATVCVIGWPELVGDALPPRGDVEVLAVDSLGEGSGLVRRLRRRRASTPSTCRRRGSAPRCARRTCCCWRRWPSARPASSAVSGSLAAATVARHAEVPVWLAAGVGRLLPARMWDALADRRATRAADPWDLDEEVVPLTLVDQVVRARAASTRPTDALRRTDCPVAPELFDSGNAPGTYRQ